jgi:hypothetical protein
MSIFKEINTINFSVSYNTSVADPGPHHFGMLDPDRHKSEKQDPDPDPHQSEKVEVLEGHFGTLKGPNLEKVSGRIQIRIRLEGRIRIRIKVKSGIQICIILGSCVQIRIKVKSRIRILITV